MVSYFHTSNDLLEKGLILEPRYGEKITDSRLYSSSDHFHAQYLREMIFEDYRAAYFPDKPSRLRSVYLFNDIRLANQYREEFNRTYIYEVEIGNDTKILKSDMTLIDLTVRKSIREIHELATHFFTGGCTEKQNYEILCEGEVKIIDQIKV